MKFAFVGDLVMQELQREPSFLFKELKSVLDEEQAHLVINLESPFIKETNYPIKNKITLHAFKNGLPYLSYLNPYLINLSNNHINDYGNESVEYTIDLLKEQSLKYFGVGLKEQCFNFFVDSMEKIVFLAYATRSSDFTGSKLFAEEDFYGVKDVDLKEIEFIRKKYPSYSLIINVHWGIEDIKYPEPEKVILGRKMVDVGADLVIGHHPHIIQSYEKYKGKYIFHSIGNFYFNDIHFKLNGKEYFRKTLKHQKQGLMPVFYIKDNTVNIKSIFRVHINKYNAIAIKSIRIKESLSLKFSQNIYTILYSLCSLYRFVVLCTKRICRVILNPKTKMKQFIKDLYHNTCVGHLIISIPKYFYDLVMYRLLPEKIFLEIICKRHLGYKLNLKNPKTYNEKLQWLKLNDRKPEYTQMADKYEVRKYIADKIGEEYLIPLIGVWDTFDKIDFDKLPDKFVLKCTHDSGGVYICNDKKKFDIKDVKRKINKALKRNYYHIGKEWPYKNIKPRIIAEQFMIDESGSELKDYKFFCFDGIPELLFIATDRPHDTRFDFYDIEFNHLPFEQGHPCATKTINKPAGFNKMLSIASKLSQNIPHVRVDLYDINGKIYFGELTFTHYSGLVPFKPKIWDEILGKKIKLPIKQ